MTLARNLCCPVMPHHTLYGLGAVLSHTINGEERPVSYASRTLSPAERNYAPLDKKGAAVIFGIRKFHQYLFGQKFKIFTHHKPLLGMFKADKAVPSMASPRIQRWALLLAGYDYDLTYREGSKNGNADGLSRLPLADTVVKVPVPGDTILLMERLEATPVWADYIAEWTASDPVLQQVVRRVQQGLPEMVVSDNGTRYTSAKFGDFMARNGILHVKTAPRHPSSNGLVERSVRTFKEGMKKMDESGGTVHTKVFVSL